MDLQLAFFDPFTWFAIISGGTSLFTSWWGSRQASQADARAGAIDRDTFDAAMALENEKFDFDKWLAEQGLELEHGRLKLAEDLGYGNLALAGRRLDLDTELGRGSLELGRDRLDLDAELGRGRLDLDTELGRGHLDLAGRRLDLDSELGRGSLQLAKDRFGFDQERWGHQVDETEAGHRRMRPYREFGYRGLKNLEALTTPGVMHTGDGAGPFDLANPRGSTYAAIDAYEPREQDPLGPPPS